VPHGGKIEPIGAGVNSGGTGSVTTPAKAGVQPVGRLDSPLSRE